MHDGVSELRKPPRRIEVDPDLILHVVASVIIAVDANDTTKVVRFHDFQNLERCCAVKDYSRTGVSFDMRPVRIPFRA